MRHSLPLVAFGGKCSFRHGLPQMKPCFTPLLYISVCSNALASKATRSSKCP